MKCYLVTGAVGFIGWKVCEGLLIEGNQVIGIDELNDAYDPQLKKWRLENLKKFEKFTFYHASIVDLKNLEDLFRKFQFDAVIHLAGRAGVRQSVENPWIYVESNVIGTLNILEMMRQFGPDKLVLASTSSVYAGRTPPFKEDMKVDSPQSPYASTKLASEHLAYTYHYIYGFDVTVLRYFTVYGPAGRPDMSIFRFIKWILEDRPIQVYGDGSQARDFTYIDDIVRGTILALRPLGYEIINLGNNKPVAIKDVIELLMKLLGKRTTLEFLPSHKADVAITWADIEKAGTLLGWKPEIPIEEGLMRTVKWSLENIELIRKIKI